MGKITPNDVERMFNAIAGRLLREVRVRRKRSQGWLGRLLDLTFSQVQKMEKGTNRVSIGRFIQLCRALNVDPVEMLSLILANGNSDKLRTTGSAMPDDDEQVLLASFAVLRKDRRGALRDMAMAMANAELLKETPRP